MRAAGGLPRAGRGDGFPALDWFRLIAAVLVVCIHTSPLTSYTPLGDFWLTRVLARVAVPFFLMVSGHFLARNGWKSLWRFLKKILLVYGCAVVLYLPLNWYSAGIPLAQWPQALLIDGTFYHLWYFPAVALGALVARQLWRLGPGWALAVAAVLYLVGLGGDSYYGLASQLPALKAMYGAIFSVSEYTRNGLFFTPLFLLLGAAANDHSHPRPAPWALGFALSLGAMTAEGLWLHSLGVQRHDSMYLMLPVCMVCLFSLLLGENRGRNRQGAQVSLLVYVLHPWCIVVLRAGAKLLGLEQLLIENSLGHFAGVLVLSFLGAWVLSLLLPGHRNPRARAWREIDLEALAHNAWQIREALAPECDLMAVVKAEAYGHGAIPVARQLRKEGVKTFGVASLEEGIALRRHGVLGEVLVLGYTAPDQARQLRRWQLTQAVVDAAHGEALAAQGVTLKVHLALDTGMHRLGIPARDHEAIRRMYRLPRLKITGTFSHLCVSDSPAPGDKEYTRRQLELFYQTLDWMRGHGCPPGETHIQASYGIWNLPPQRCTWARPGIALYGVGSDDTPTRRQLDLRPVLSLKARVASVRELEPGQGAGYGLAFRPDTPRVLATVTIGYADGLPRSLPQHGGRVLIHGKRCPMVGRVCMDQLLVDVTEVPGVVPGDLVTLIGRDGRQQIRAEEVAAQCGTITNELLSRLGSRLPVVEVREGR